MNRLLLLLATLVLCSLESRGQAQSVEDILNSFNDTAQIKRQLVSAQAPPISDKKWNQIRSKWINLNFGMAIILDHNIVGQNDDSRTQVGEISDATEFRGDRFMATGTLNFKNPVKYMVSVNFNGMDAPQGKKSFEFVDWNFEIPLPKKAGWITIGKQKEGVGVEYVAPGTQLLFTERGTGAPMLIRQRNIGIRYSNTWAKERMSSTIGFFNNYWETGKSFSDNGGQITARVTGLLRYTSDADLFHVGLGYRYSGATSNQVSLRAKPEINTAPFFIQTGNVAASGFQVFTAEAILAKGPLLAMAEIFRADVHSHNTGNPTIYYWQAGVGYFLTGEHRRYNKQNGNPGKVIPKKNFNFKKGAGPGAWEIESRLTRTDATNQALTGGEFLRLTAGISWFPNTHFRVAVNYGRGWLEKNDLNGKIHALQLRTQFEF
jgi:phosphate-selective porin OprO and OprP